MWSGHPDTAFSQVFMYNLKHTDQCNCLAPNSYNAWWLCSIDHDEWDCQVLSQLLPLCSQWSIKNNRLQGLMTQQMMWKALIESNRDTKVCCTESITYSYCKIMKSLFEFTWGWPKSVSSCDWVKYWLYFKPFSDNPLLQGWHTACPRA